jgi:hypothetical protein
MIIYVLTLYQIQIPHAVASSLQLPAGTITVLETQNAMHPRIQISTKLIFEN